MKLSLLAFGAIILVACAQQPTYVNPSLSANEMAERFRIDRTQCLQAAYSIEVPYCNYAQVAPYSYTTYGSMAGIANGLQLAAIRQAREAQQACFVGCMSEHGWQRPLMTAGSP